MTNITRKEIIELMLGACEARLIEAEHELWVRSSTSATYAAQAVQKATKAEITYWQSQLEKETEV